MLWLFIGVAIVSDKFMESIEMITAQEKEVSVKDPRTGKTQVVIVKVWNETVANLTLMAQFQQYFVQPAPRSFKDARLPFSCFPPCPFPGWCPPCRHQCSNLHKLPILWP